MKKLTGMLALVALFCNIAGAELLKNFKYDGKIEVNAVTTNNNVDADSDVKDKSSDADIRVQLNAGFDLAEDVGAMVSAVKCNRQYGNAAGETVAAGTADGFTFEQAYLNLNGVLGINHKVGRQYYGEEGDLVIYFGPRNWPYDWAGAANGLGVAGLDAYTGWYKGGKLEINALLSKKTQGAASQPDSLDVDIVGVTAKYDLMEPVKLGAYVYEQKTWQVAGAADLTLDVIGVKANGKFMGFDYSAELAKNYGRKAAGVNYTGTAFLANAKYDMNILGKITFMGEFAMGSGNKSSAGKDEGFTAIASDYRPGILMGGIGNLAGLNNLFTWNLGAKWNPEMIEKLTLKGKLYHFGTSEKVTVGPNSYDSYGNEFDLAAGWQHNANVNLKAYYAMFLPGDDYSKATLANKDDLNTALGAALTVKF